MCRQIVSQLVIIFGLSLWGVAEAVEAPALDSRFRLVGIIAAEDRKGNDASLAVIRDEQSGRSMMVRKGESLPGSGGVVLSAIKRSEIELTSAGQIFTVGYGGTEAKEEKKDFVPEFLNTEELDAFYYERRLNSGEGSGEPNLDYSYVPSTDGGVEPFDTGMIRDDVRVGESIGDATRSYDEGPRGEMPAQNAPVPAQEPRVSVGGAFNEYEPSNDEGTQVEFEDPAESIGTVEATED